MMMEMTAGGVIAMVVALLAAGALMGFVAGLLGVGGGGILVPVLYEAFGLIEVAPDVRMHLAVGTSLAVILPTSLRGFQAHHAKGAVDVALLKRIAPAMVLGVLIGIVLAASVESFLLKAVWVVFGGGLALKMALGRDEWRLGEELPRPPFVELYSLLVGIVSVMMSIAGASFMVTYLTLYGRAIHQAVATSAGLGPLVAIPGVIGFVWSGWGHEGLPAFSLGYVNLLGAGLIIPTSIALAPVGVRFAHGISKRALELLFAAFLGLVAVRFAFSLLLG